MLKQTWPLNNTFITFIGKCTAQLRDPITVGVILDGSVSAYRGKHVSWPLNLCWIASHPGEHLYQSWKLSMNGWYFMKIQWEVMVDSGSSYGWFCFSLLAVWEAFTVVLQCFSDACTSNYVPLYWHFWNLSWDIRRLSKAPTAATEQHLIQPEPMCLPIDTGRTRTHNPVH